jgi:hypothetical protein
LWNKKKNNWKIGIVRTFLSRLTIPRATQKPIIRPAYGNDQPLAFNYGLLLLKLNEQEMIFTDD